LRGERQAPELDEAQGGVVVELVAAVIGCQGVVVERVLGPASDDRAVPGGELEPDRAADKTLGALHIRREFLVQRAVPLPVVDQPRILARDRFFETRLVATERETLQSLVRGVQNDRSRSFVDFARLDTYQAILNVIDAPDPIGSGQGV